MARYRVLSPYQVSNAGKVYQAGETFEANDDDDMKSLVASEIIVRVERESKRKPSKGKR